MKVNTQALDAYVRTARVGGTNAVDRPADHAEHPKPEGPSEAANEAASVSISDAGRALASGHASSPEKIQRLKHEVANGTFQVDDHVVAKKLLNVTG